MLTEENDILGEFAETVFQLIFADGQPVPHIFIRDYARGVIEAAVFRHVAPETIDMSMIIPPYSSKWPLEIPDEDDTAPWPDGWFFHGPDRSDWTIYILEPSCHNFSRVSARELGLTKTEAMKKTNQMNDFRVLSTIAERWIKWRIRDLGWTAERFADFDKRITEYGFSRRIDTSKPERIGKKYAWIALYEFLAYLADNMPFTGDTWGLEPEEYCGPWQPRHRDIDPSLLLRETLRTEASETVNAWWQPVKFEFKECEEVRVKDWLMNESDIFDPIDLIDIRGTHGEQWLALEGFYDWTEKAPPDRDPYETPRRNLWLMIKSYIVKADHGEDLMQWLKEQNLWGRWMPESQHTNEMFLGEFPWAPSFKQYDAADPWTVGLGPELPHPVLVTAISYLWEPGYDCSIDGTIYGQLPSPWIVRNMKLRWSHQGFSFVNSKGKRIAFDPSTDAEGPSILLMAKYELSDFLSKRNLKLVWTILGERWQVFLRGDSSKYKGHSIVQAVYGLMNDEVVGGPIQLMFKEPPQKIIDSGK
jgi:hypothetical protein